MKKGVVIGVAAILLLLFTGIASASMADFWASLFGEAAAPQLIGAIADPIKVRPGDTLTTIVEVEDPYGIDTATSFYFHEKGFDEVPMILVASDLQTNRKTYQSSWEVHDTLDQKWYETLYEITNVKGKTLEGMVKWQDPTVSHGAEQVEPGTFQAGEYIFPGTVNASTLKLENSLNQADCVKITGSTSLCDGSDAVGGGFTTKSVFTSSGNNVGSHSLGSANVCCPGSPGTGVGGGCETSAAEMHLLTSRPSASCASNNGWSCTYANNDTNSNSFTVYAICLG